VTALALAVALAFSPFTKEEEHVREGNEALLAGDAPRALSRYEAAERAVGERPELDFDRAHAARALGRDEEADAHLRRAADRGEPRLASRALQNLGRARAGRGDREGALAAYAEALLADPGNEDARHDLEVLLRREEAEERRTPGDGAAKPGDPQPGRGPAPSQPGADPAQRERPSPGVDEKPAGAPEPRPDGGGTRGDGAAGDAAPERTRQEAERLLDALRARERDLPVLRGEGRERKGGGRADADQDW
jgi:Ca-activated chloride channel homolog